MITVYFDRGCGFSQITLSAIRADVSVVGQREILTVSDYADGAIAQFDMNAVVGWCNNDYVEDDGGEEE
jgi:hypothetical protein